MIRHLPNHIFGVLYFNKVDTLNKKTKLPFRIVNKYNEIKTSYDEDAIRKVLLKDIELILYNNRDIPIYTKRINYEL